MLTLNYLLNDLQKAMCGGNIPKAEAQQYSLICKNSQKITFMKP
jgi:hypothetical protein